MKRAEVAEHNTRKDCWIVLGKKVFDVTEFIKCHPGKEEPILDFAGQDATEAFRKAHFYVNYSELLDYELVGIVED